MSQRHGMAAVLAVAMATCTPAALAAEDWAFEIEPYVLVTSIDGDASLGRIQGATVDVAFDDILENLDMAAMVHFEGHHRSGFGFSLDYGFMDLGTESSNARGGVVESSVRQGILEGRAIHRWRFEESQLDGFVGLRWWDNDVDVRVDPAVLPGDIERDIEADWVDLIIGARWTRPFNARWSLSITGDIGGMAGGADFTSSTAAGVRYDFGDRWSLDLQYKATWVDYEEGNAGEPGFFAYDTVTHGPLVGFIFKL